jgi:hypothetical protein
VKKLEVADFEKAIDLTFPCWAKQCHGVSLEIIKSGILGEPARVARGSCLGVGFHQHSWIVLGMDCYAEDAQIIDPTLWSYDETVEGIWYGTLRDKKHVPHGYGNVIFELSRLSPRSNGNIIKLKGRMKLSKEANAFLDRVGPLDQQGWHALLHSPVMGWPSGEIIEAAYKMKELRAMIPIDIVGMLLLVNPGGLYF